MKQRFSDIAGRPESIDKNWACESMELEPKTMSVMGVIGMHESLLRSFAILEQVKEWLEKGVPNDVIIDLIWELEHYPETDEEGN